MKTAFVECTGVRSGRMAIPPFCVGGGDCLCVHLPFPRYCASYRRLERLLAGEIRAAGIQVRGRVRRVPVPRSFLRGLLFAPRERAGSWLARSARLPMQSAMDCLRSLGVDPTCRVTALGGTWRTLLGLAVNWESGADVVIYSTDGLDPLGVARVNHCVEQRLDRTAAIHIAGPKLSGDRACPSCAECVCVTEIAEEVDG